jgi:hypothetical protein
MLDLPVDFRGKGGLAVVTGWGRSLTGSIAPPMPDWLRTLVVGSNQLMDARRWAVPAAVLTNERMRDYLRHIEQAREGARNHTLFVNSVRIWEGWALLPEDHRPSTEAVTAAIVTRAVRTGLDEYSARATVESAARTARGEAGA